MKNIEKLAIDSTIRTIQSEVSADILQLTERKNQFEVAKKHYQDAAVKLMEVVKAASAEIANELSEEGKEYMDAQLTAIGCPIPRKTQG